MSALPASALPASTLPASTRRPLRIHPSAVGQQVFLVRRLAVLFGVMVATIVVSLVISTRFADADTSGPSANSANAVIVQPGDTFWKLARSVQPTGDVRPLVAQLAREHGGSALRAGDRIVLPER